MLPLKPNRGGFFRPFGTGQFIKAFLAGRGPDFDAPRINPKVGAPQSDIHAAYKGALHRAIAEDAAAWDAGEAIRKGKPMTPVQVEERRRFYLERIPYKLTKMRYQSFHTYFGHIKRLGWVEETKTELSEFQQDYADPPASPRIFYRLTAKGRHATDDEWSDPIMTLYKYSRAVRSSKKQRYYRPPQQQHRHNRRHS
jgi:hypothetical protein